jgi:hypothetical protein
LKIKILLSKLPIKKFSKMFRSTRKLLQIPKKFLPPSDRSEKIKNVLLGGALLTSFTILMFNAYDELPINQRKRFLFVPKSLDEVIGTQMLNMVKGGEHPEVPSDDSV